MDSVKDYIRIKRVSMDMTSDRREWKKKKCCVNPTYWDKGMMMMSLLLASPAQSPRPQPLQ
jgi:hypothetical protein